MLIVRPIQVLAGLTGLDPEHVASCSVLVLNVSICWFSVIIN